MRKRLFFLILACFLLLPAALAETKPPAGFEKSLQDGVLTWTGDNGEYYQFEKIAGEYVLTRAQKETLQAVLRTSEQDGMIYCEGYDMEDAASSGIWAVDFITLSAFNYSRFPDSAQETQDLNEKYALLGGERCFGGDWSSVIKQALGSGSAAVYTAPDTLSYRADAGKALAGLSGEVTIHGHTNDGWTLIEYEASSGKRRIGYVQSSSLGDAARSAGALVFCSMPAFVRKDSFATDDPSGAKLLLSSWSREIL